MATISPSVSICIPTYNYRRYLANALDSALAQDFGDMEILVVDNCSDDGTPELVEDYCRRDSRIVFHRNPRNLGMTANFNRALDLAQGKYVKFLCADDILERNCVGIMVDVLESNRDVTLVGCRRAIFEDDKRTVRVLGYADKSFSRSGRQVIRECYFRGNLIGEPTAVLFRKSDSGAGFDERYHHALDMELWFRLLENGRFAFLDNILCRVRKHDSMGTSKNLRTARVTADKVRLFEQYGSRSFMHGTVAECVRWDARMASSFALELAAGATESAEVAKKALYFPKLSSAILVPLASALTNARRRPRN
jgi:glycosyltransferase involved in cell wall biosynthesis